MASSRSSFLLRSLMALGVVGAALAVDNSTASAQSERKVIIFVWDGLRPDFVTPTDTPNLYALRDAGVDFTDNHSTYPTFTMMNAASFATGGFPDSTGYYGNTLWQPGTGQDSANATIDFQQPIFTEDYAILTTITYLKGDLLIVDTLFRPRRKLECRPLRSASGAPPSSRITSAAACCSTKRPCCH